jgi:DNA-binding PadR family transcriptional regulator
MTSCRWSRGPCIRRWSGSRSAGWATSKWGVSPTGRRARYYTITASGKRQLGQEIADFDTVLLAIARVLGRAEAP